MNIRAIKKRSDLRRFHRMRNEANETREAFIDSGVGDLEHTLYRVNVSYPLHIYREPEDPSPTLRRLARGFAGQEIGSGAGQRRRDISFAFRTFIESLAFLSDVEQANNPFVRVDDVVAESDFLDDDQLVISLTDN